MSVLDLFIISGLLAAGLGGYRLGFLSRILSWAGLGLGVLVGNRFLPALGKALKNSDPMVSLLAVTLFLVLVSLLGQALGLAIGKAVHKTLPVAVGLRQGDRFAGATVGILGVLVMVWLLSPAIARVPGWPSKAAKESAIARGVEAIAPDPPDTSRALRRFIDRSGFPTVFDDLRASPTPGPPPANGLPVEIHERVARSTVKVQGAACDRLQEGSGFAAAQDLVVTNAHVVAGDTAVEVETQDGRTLEATVVVFDEKKDLAVLRIPNLGLAPLPIGHAEEGEAGAVYGHPGGGPLRASPASVHARITATGRDIYDRQKTQRDVYVLASKLEKGDSGGAFIDMQGTVAGVAFAIAFDEPNTAYAVTDKELRPVVALAGRRPVSTGNCLG
ncbi:MAG: MarP family serine protease [Acidimicrobiia bacterium]